MQVECDFNFFRFFHKPYILDNAMSYPAVRTRVSLIAVVAVILKQGREKDYKDGPLIKEAKKKQTLIST